MLLAVHIPHPAAAHKSQTIAVYFLVIVNEYLLMSSFTGCCKGGIFL